MTSEGPPLTELDWKTLKRVFKGTSVPVEDVWLYVDCGGEEEYEKSRFLEAYPEICREQLDAWLMSGEEQRLHHKEARMKSILVHCGAIAFVVFLVVLACWIIWGLLS